MRGRQILSKCMQTGLRASGGKGDGEALRQRGRGGHAIRNSIETLTWQMMQMDANGGKTTRALRCKHLEHLGLALCEHELEKLGCVRKAALFRRMILHRVVSKHFHGTALLFALLRTHPILLLCGLFAV